MFALIKSLGGIVLTSLATNPIKAFGIIKFGYGLLDDVEKLKSENKQEKLDSSVQLARKILDYKKREPEEFELLCGTIEKVLEKYESDPATRAAIIEKVEQAK